MSPEEDALLETAVALSGLTKQDYIIRRHQCIAVCDTFSADLLDTIRLIAVTMDGMQSES